MQLLLCNDRFYARDPRVNTALLRYLKVVTGTNLPTPDEAGLSANITKEVNHWVEKAIDGNCCAANNGAKGKYDRQVCS